MRSTPEPCQPVGRTVDAIVIDCDTTAPPHRRVPSLVRRQIEALCELGVHVAVLSCADIGALASRWPVRPTGPGRLWLGAGGGARLYEIGPDGPRRTAGLDERADPMREVLSLFEALGVGPGLVLVVGASRDGLPDRAAHVRGGPHILRLVLDEQLRRRRLGRVPAVDHDPEWTLTVSGPDRLRERVVETLLTLGAGGLGTRGSVEEPSPGATPLVLADGVYTGNGPEQHLLPGPVWTGLDLQSAPERERRTLDLRTGVLLREELGTDPPLRVLRLVSAALPGVAALSAEAGAGRLRPGAGLREPDHGTAVHPPDGRPWMLTQGAGGGIAAAATDLVARDGGIRTVRRIAGYVADSQAAPDPRRAADLLHFGQALGFDRLLAEHRRVWARRWDAVNVAIPDDPSTQLAIRLALFHLWCNATGLRSGAVGARGLSGPGYRGHVFWDADVFVLPAVATMDPAAARAMIGYRLRRLDAARAAARAAGHGGSRFPWESAADGTEVTPLSGYVGGQLVPIKTGQQEEHITADVAWAAWHYAQWSGDRAFAAGPGRLLLLDTARYWASRYRIDPAGRAHLDGVIGPDEYHEAVPDNAFTNVMARWNLRQAAAVADPVPERDAWLQLAGRIVDGHNPVTGVYEQFSGYFALSPLLVAEVATPPVAADVLLGRPRVEASQLIKQPDVLMLHHLVPDEVAPGSLAPNLDFYLPRTAHGSSLSPAITASLLARAGRPDEAHAMLQIALRLDLDDLTGTTAAGLHLATLGGVWQAVLFGFAGARIRGGTLHIDPSLPAAWPRLDVRFRALGRRLRVGIRHDQVDVRTDGPLPIRVAGGSPRQVNGHERFRPAGRSA